MGEPNQGRTTIAEVAKRAGVSISTVSRVMNGLDRVHPETRERVSNVIQTLRYQPSAFARGLAIQQTRTLGFVIPTISDPFYLNIVRGVEEKAAAAGYSLLVISQLSGAGDQRILELFTQKRVDGLIIVGTVVPQELLVQLRTQSFPVVLLQQHAERTISVDNYGGATLLTDHLLELGYRTLAYIAGSGDTPDDAERFRGFQASLVRAGIAFDPRLFVQGDFLPGSGAEAATELLARNTPFKAIFAANDQMAIDAVLALRERGLSVPEDVAVVGFDDVPLARYVLPPLTTVRQPAYELGSSGVEAVLSALRGEPLPEGIILPVELVVRESCGAKLASARKEDALHPSVSL